jgi:hypothetical protein
MNLSDNKPEACGGSIMRRTDSHVISNNKIAVTRSGDSHIKPPLFNLAETKYPDSDPRWGLEGCEYLKAKDPVIAETEEELITEADKYIGQE